LPNKARALEWESRWAVPAGVATFVAVALLIAGAFVSGPIHGDDKAAILRAAHQHGAALIASGVLQAAGFALLVFPLVVLFRAVRARSDRVRVQLIGLVVAAPLFFAVATLTNAPATKNAATHFVDGKAKATLTEPEAAKECRSDLQDKGAKPFGEEFEAAKGETALAACEVNKVENNEADNAISEQSLTDIAEGFSLGGRLGLAISLLYTCLFAMRVGLLTRFWGSLGMALGAAALLGLVLFLVIWFIYFGLLLLGRLPGGRPPAWAAGEAIPWPTPGEKAAAELEPEDPIDPPPPSEGDGGSDAGGGRRKRKRRD
jgi:hypothetical protein